MKTTVLLALVPRLAGLVRSIDSTNGAMPDELTARITALPVMEGLRLSLAATVCLPAVYSVGVKMAMPPLSVVLIGSAA